MDLSGGRKMLYSQNYYTKEEFWSVYDKGKKERERERERERKGRKEKDKFLFFIFYFFSFFLFISEKYDHIRKKWKAEGLLPNIFEKVC